MKWNACLPAFTVRALNIRSNRVASLPLENLSRMAIALLRTSSRRGCKNYGQRRLLVWRAAARRWVGAFALALARCLGAQWFADFPGALRFLLLSQPRPQHPHGARRRRVSRRW